MYTTKFTNGNEITTMKFEGTLSSMYQAIIDQGGMSRDQKIQVYKGDILVCTIKLAEDLKTTVIDFEKGV